jgi:glycosyltransferase involved in cell wall biosynthesis
MRHWQSHFPASTRSRLRRLASRILQPLLDRQWVRSARAADGFVVSCHDDARFLNDRYGVDQDRIGVIPMGPPQESLDQPVRPLTAERLNRLLYVAQFAYFKAPAVLGRAVTRILRQRPDARMTWVCDLAHHAQAQALLAPDIQARVSFRGWMPQAALAEIFDEHGVFLFPSFFEGFGKTPLEAMARGLAVIASDTGGMCDFIEHNRSGLLVPVGEHDVFATEALRVIDDFDLASRLSAGARTAANAYSWERCARDAEDFYHRLLAAKRTPSSASDANP